MVLPTAGICLLSLLISTAFLKYIIHKKTHFSSAKKKKKKKPPLFFYTFYNMPPRNLFFFSIKCWVFWFVKDYQNHTFITSIYTHQHMMKWRTSKNFGLSRRTLTRFGLLGQHPFLVTIKLRCQLEYCSVLSLCEWEEGLIIIHDMSILSIRCSFFQIISSWMGKLVARYKMMFYSILGYLNQALCKYFWNLRFLLHIFQWPTKSVYAQVKHVNLDSCKQQISSLLILFEM